MKRTLKMKTLVKIKLVNWHIFQDNTIPLKDNTLIFGENGSGKSTLIDAIHYVIDGGKDVKFNTAVNLQGSSINKRTVESYIRLKTGVEGKEYVRNGDVVSHIALEFFDEVSKKSSVIGVVLELANGEHKEKSTFYHVVNSSFDDNWFFNENKNQVHTFKQFRSYLDSLNLNFHILDGSKADVFKAVHQALGILRERDTYSDLLNKAIAFRPIDNVSDFVYNYLMPEKSVNLNELKNLIRSYREVKKLVDEENSKKEILEKIDIDGNAYLTKKKDVLVITHLINEIDLENHIKNVNKLNKEIANLESENKDLEDKNNSLNKDKESLLEQKIALSSNSNAITYNSLIKNLESEKHSLKSTQSDIRKLTSCINQEQQRIKVLNVDINLKGYLKDKDFKSFKESLNSYKEIIKNDLSKTLRGREKELSNEINALEKEENSNTSQIEQLKKSNNVYKQHIPEFIKLVKEEVKEKYHIDNLLIEPFCEGIEIKNEFENDRNDIEMFLNNRRFDLLVNSKYFPLVSRIYSEHRKEFESISVVDLSKIDPDLKASENSLYYKLDVSSSTNEAELYARYLLGNTAKLNSFDDFTYANNEVLEGGFVYSVDKISQRKQSIALYPFIGKGSIKKRIEILIKKNQAIEEKLKVLKPELDLIKFKLDQISESLVIVLLTSYCDKNLFEIEDSTNKKIESLEKQINELVANDIDLLDLNNRIKEFEKQINEINEKIRNFENKKYDNNIRLGGLKNSLDNENKNIVSLKEFLEKDNKSPEFKAAYSERNAVYKALTKEHLDENLKTFKHEIDVLIVKIEKNMAEYNTKFGEDLTPNIDSLNNYFEFYHNRIQRDLNKYSSKLTEYEEKAKKGFQEDYISKIRRFIKEEQEHISKLNKILKDKPFGVDQDVYEFMITRNKDERLGRFYDIFMSNRDYENESRDLFTDDLRIEERDNLNQLFNTLTKETNTTEEEKKLKEFTDYRSFMSYDIKIRYKNGEISYFSKVNNEKSGGETQTPFYIMIAASFEQIFRASALLNKKESPMGLVILDEAFNNMDEQRIEAMIKYFKTLEVQFLIVVPTQRAAMIMKYMDTNIPLVKHNNVAIALNGYKI